MTAAELLSRIEAAAPPPLRAWIVARRGLLVAVVAEELKRAELGLGEVPPPPSSLEEVLLDYVNDRRPYTGSRVRITGYGGATVYGYWESVRHGILDSDSAGWLLAAKGYDPKTETLVLPEEPELILLVMDALRDWANAEEEDAEQRTNDPEGKRMARAASKGLTTAVNKVQEAFQKTGANYLEASRRAADVRWDGREWQDVRWDGHEWQMVRANPAPAVKGSRLGDEAWLFDAEGRRYRVSYQVLPAVRAATPAPGRVVASHHPLSLTPQPGYPREFQARDLAAEVGKLDAIAKGLEPERVLVQHADPTLGPPVVWEGPDGTFYALAGNSRTVAMMRADDATFDRYLSTLRADWGALLPSENPPLGTRWLLVRVVTAADGSPLPIREAVQLAGASQGSSAGAESLLGKARSTARSLGLDSLDKLPAFQWSGVPVHAENVGDFIRANQGFWREVLSRLDPARRDAVSRIPEEAALLAQSLFAGVLPPDVDFEDPRESQAILAALPTLVGLHLRVRGGQVKADWDLLPRLPVAMIGARVFAKLSPAEVVGRLEAEASQGALFGGAAKPLLAELEPLGAMLALAVKKATERANPGAAMAEYLGRYVQAAEADAPGQGGFGFGPPPNPALALAEAIDRRLLPAVRRAVDAWSRSSEPRRVANGRRRNIGLFGQRLTTYNADRVVILRMGLGRDSLAMLGLLAEGSLAVAGGRMLGPADVDAVVFSDPGYEWPATYEVIPRVEAICRQIGVPFFWQKKPPVAAWTAWLRAWEAARLPAEDLEEDDDDGATAPRRSRIPRPWVDEAPPLPRRPAHRLNAPLSAAEVEALRARCEGGYYQHSPPILEDYQSRNRVILMADGSCTQKHKIAPGRRLQADIAALRFGVPDNAAWGRDVKAGRRSRHVSLLGIAADELSRRDTLLDPEFDTWFEELQFPLVELGIDRAAETPILARWGLAEAQKSGCMVCKYQKEDWYWALSQIDPASYQKAVEWELTAEAAAARDGRPLRDAHLLRTAERLPERVAAWRAAHPEATVASVLANEYKSCKSRYSEGQKRKRNPCPMCGDPPRANGRHGVYYTPGEVFKVQGWTYTVIHQDPNSLAVTYDRFDPIIALPTRRFEATVGTFRYLVGHQAENPMATDGIREVPRVNGKPSLPTAPAGWKAKRGREIGLYREPVDGPPTWPEGSPERAALYTLSRGAAVLLKWIPVQGRRSTIAQLPATYQALANHDFIEAFDAELWNELYRAPTLKVRITPEGAQWLEEQALRRETEGAKRQGLLF